MNDLSASEKKTISFRLDQYVCKYIWSVEEKIINHYKYNQ